jgi:hypothetical protein
MHKSRQMASKVRKCLAETARAAERAARYSSSNTTKHGKNREQVDIVFSKGRYSMYHRSQRLVCTKYGIPSMLKGHSNIKNPLLLNSRRQYHMVFYGREPRYFSSYQCFVRVHSRLVRFSMSRSLSTSAGLSRISIPGPIGLAFRELGKTWGILV